MLQSILRADPLGTLDADYAEAVLRLAWAIDRKSRERILVCAAVELIPREVPAPIVGPERFIEISRQFFVYARDVVVSARRGIAWFEDARRGLALKPDSAGGLPQPGDTGAAHFSVGAFVLEPSDDSFLASTMKVPFSADWQHSPRARHLLTEPGPLATWNTAERTRAVDWLKKELHVDLELFPEYAGSVQLVAPNPVFRDLFVTHEKDDEGRSHLVVAVTARAGQRVDGLELIVEEKRATGIGLLARHTLVGPCVRIALPHYPEELRERVIDPRRGLLYEGHFGRFDVGFTLRTTLMSRVRRVELEAPQESYEVPLAGALDSVSRIGPPTATRTAGGILHEAEGRRRRQERGRASQRWFRDRAPDAVKALRELVKPAEERLFVCDPYFGGDDLLRVILAVANPETKVQILTSAMHLRDRHGVASDLLERRLAEVHRAPPMNPLEVRVMLGDKPAIHDRFITTEKQTWMLGASINNFGERGTLMLVVPDPEPVREDLLRVWSESPTFSAWLTARRTAASA